MFSHKSNFLQFVFQQQICFQFQMPLFKMTCCLSTIIESLSFLNDLLVNIYPYSLVLSSFFCIFLCIAPASPADYLSQATVTVRRFTQAGMFYAHDPRGAINIYNRTVNIDKQGTVNDLYYAFYILAQVQEICFISLKWSNRLDQFHSITQCHLG